MSRLLLHRLAERRLCGDTSGVALLEFAFSLPFLLLLSLTGAELTNYIITRMRVSQVALHIADNAARIGSGTQLEAKRIDEAQINDLLTGADLQAGELGLFANGRVILSSLEPDSDADTEDRYVIRWQRCKGAKTSYLSSYGNTGDIKDGGMGPDGRKVTAPEEGVTMFVEVRYHYQPLIRTAIAPASEIRETASMMVRDRRDTSDDSDKGSAATHPDGVHEVSGATPSMCGP